VKARRPAQGNSALILETVAHRWLCLGCGNAVDAISGTGDKSKRTTADSSQVFLGSLSRKNEYRKYKLPGGDWRFQVLVTHPLAARAVLTVFGSRQFRSHPTSSSNSICSNPHLAWNGGLAFAWRVGDLNPYRGFVIACAEFYWIRSLMDFSNCS
jgi:hypothetical protein